jgi:large subunit ribosomal protein L10
LPTVEKEKKIAELAAKIGGSKTIVFADFRGLTVQQDTKLRSKLRAAGVEYRVAKNTLIERAAGLRGITGLHEFLHGPTSVAFSGEDLTAPARILSDAAKETKILQIKGGMLDSKPISKEAVLKLAELPSRPILLAMLCGTLNAPIANLARAIDQIREQKSAVAAN